MLIHSPVHVQGVDQHSLDVDRGQLDPDEWPCTIPAIRQVVEGGLAFTRPVTTVLIGENLFNELRRIAQAFRAEGGPAVLADLATAQRFGFRCLDGPADPGRAG